MVDTLFGQTRRRGARIVDGAIATDGRIALESGRRAGLAVAPTQRGTKIHFIGMTPNIGQKATASADAFAMSANTQANTFEIQSVNKHVIFASTMAIPLVSTLTTASANTLDMSANT